MLALLCRHGVEPTILVRKCCPGRRWGGSVGADPTLGSPVWLLGTRCASRGWMPSRGSCGADGNVAVLSSVSVPVSRWDRRELVEPQPTGCPHLLSLCTGSLVAGAALM